MIPALQQYPRFEKGSPSTEYQQIINFCVNYLEGMLVGLIHMDIPADIEQYETDIKILQKRLLSRERTVRHAFQFQIEKHFSDFKSISRSRLKVNHSRHNTTSILSVNASSKIQDLIEEIDIKHQTIHLNQLLNTTKRLKTLVHRSDDKLDNNPVSPLNLCRAFLASIETLNFSAQKNRYLLILFEHTLEQQLGNFYNQIDLGLYYLDILVELTSPELFLPPEDKPLAEDYTVAKVINEVAEDLTDSEVITEIAEDLTDTEVASEVSEDPTDIETITEVAEDSTHTEVLTEAVEDSFQTEVVDNDTTATLNGPQPTPPENTVLSLSDGNNVTSIDNHLHKVKQQQEDVDQYLKDFKDSTENGVLDLDSIFFTLKNKLNPIVGKKQRNDIQKFIHFFTSLLNNTLLSTPLKTQLSRLSSPLLEMVLIDPFFFRSSTHPINDFLLSIVDFELRFKHQGESLAALSLIIDTLLDIQKPSLSDYQPLIDKYESFKSIEAVRLEEIKEEHHQQEEVLKNKMLQMINTITEELVVDQKTMQFFYDDWQLLLIHLAKSPGEESAEFKNSVNIAKMLSWFLDHNKTGYHPRFESISFKSLLTSIEIGLVTLNFASEHRHRIRKQLVKEYKLANQKQNFSIIPSLPKKNTTNKLKLAHSNRQQPDEKSMAMAKSFNIGDWVEINISKNKKFSRAKLKWKNADSSLFIFIDQRGHKIKECDLKELSIDLANGNIRILKKPSVHLNIF